MGGPQSIRAEIRQLSARLGKLTQKTTNNPVVQRLRLDPLTTLAEHGVRLDWWQSQALMEQDRQVATLCCRGAGKTFAEATRQAVRMLTIPGYRCLLFSPTHRQAAELLSYVKDVWRALGKPISAESEAVTMLALTNGSRAISLPDNEKGVRGFHVDEVVLDEAARISDGLYYSVRPMVKRRKGAIRAPTTPFGKRGWFWDVWGSERESWRRRKVTAEECGRFTPEELEDERRENPWYDQEYGLEFRDAIDAVFKLDEIEAASDSTIIPLFAGWEQ